MQMQGAEIVDLFDYARHATKLRDAGMSVAAFAQDSKCPDWSDLAFAAIVYIARKQSTVHVDDVLQAFDLKPEHPNSWGAVWMRAIKTGVIERSGQMRPCITDPGKHKHQYAVYRSNITQQEVAT